MTGIIKEKKKDDRKSNFLDATLQRKAATDIFQLYQKNCMITVVCG